MWGFFPLDTQLSGGPRPIQAPFWPRPVCLFRWRCWGGVGVTTLLATAIGFLSIRRQGIYFAMVTLAFAQMVYYIANELRSLTGGENGVQGVPRTLWELDLSNPLAFYYAALPLVVLGFFLAWRTVRSPFGHVLIAVREEEARAQALGYPTTRFKFLAFLLSAGLSALAGGLYALNHGFVALEVVHWSTSGLVVMMAILGGIGTLWGGAFGGSGGVVAARLAFGVDRCLGRSHRDHLRTGGSGVPPGHLGQPDTNVATSQASDTQKLGVCPPMFLFCNLYKKSF